MPPDYHAILRTLPDWEPYLLAESHLPGPRANLELAHAVADLATAEQIERLLVWGPEIAPTPTPESFLAVCGVIALGRRLAEGERQEMERLRAFANDPRWRVREAVAMALQRLGAANPQALVTAMQSWSQGTLLEQRATAAGLCEPFLLANTSTARATLNVLDQITTNLSQVAPDQRKQDDFQTLRKGLGYCWSVAVAALPEEGKPHFEHWAACEDRDVRWVIKENLKKNRLLKMDAQWVATWKSRLT